MNGFQRAMVAVGGAACLFGLVIASIRLPVFNGAHFAGLCAAGAVIVFIITRKPRS